MTRGRPARAGRAIPIRRARATPSSSNTGSARTARAPASGPTCGGSAKRSARRGTGRGAHMGRLGKPIIAAVNGWAMGGGFWYQLAADITIASDKAVFAQPEVRHISNSSFLFAALCGWKAANRWALTGDHFDAQEALRIGMVNEVVPHDQLMAHTRALAKRLTHVPEPSLRYNKAITMLGIQASGLH